MNHENNRTSSSNTQESSHNTDYSAGHARGVEMLKAANNNHNSAYRDGYIDAFNLLLDSSPYSNLISESYRQGVIDAISELHHSVVNSAGPRPQ